MIKVVYRVGPAIQLLFLCIICRLMWGSFFAPSKLCLMIYPFFFKPPSPVWDPYRNLVFSNPQESFLLANPQLALFPPLPCVFRYRPCFFTHEPAFFPPRTLFCHARPRLNRTLNQPQATKNRSYTSPNPNPNHSQARPKPTQPNPTTAKRRHPTNPKPTQGP